MLRLALLPFRSVLEHSKNSIFNDNIGNLNKHNYVFRAKIAARKTPISSFYFDMNWLGNYWGCDKEPRKYVFYFNNKVLFYFI